MGPNSASCLLMDVDPQLHRQKEGVDSDPLGLEMLLTDFATNRVRCAGESIRAHFYLAHYAETPDRKSVV